MQILSIQYLRALASCSVVAHHIGPRFGWDLEVGAAGVDLFFVISGFIMWLVAHDREISPAQFFSQRLIRIVPLYWSITLFVAAVAVVRPGYFAMAQAPFWEGLHHVTQSLLFVPHLSPADKPDPILYPGWTLNYEIFFYALFALTLFAARRLRLAGFTALITCLIVIGFISSPTGIVAFNYTNPLLVEFLAGVWLGRAWTSKSLPGEPAAWIMLAGGFAALMAAEWSSLLIGRETALRVLVWGGPAFFIVAGALALEKCRPVPAIPVLKLLGDASYSVYLTHWLTYMLIIGLISKLGFIHQGIALSLITWLGAVLAGVICYFAVERPLTTFIRRMAQGQTRFAVRA